MFNEGDKVRFVNTKSVGWEGTGTSFGADNLLDLVGVVEDVNSADNVDYSTEDEYDITVRFPGRISADTYHPSHFKLFRMSNEERIAKRRAELNI